MSDGYEKVIEYHFTVCGERIAITNIDCEVVYVSEVSKNGQEDTHISGELHKVGNKFVWVDGEDMFSQYHSQKLADGIRKHLNKYGLPKVKEEVENE